jgi:hypothetical protein
LIERVGGQPDSMPQANNFENQPAPSFNFNPPKLYEPSTVYANDNCTFYINYVSCLDGRHGEGSARRRGASSPTSSLPSVPSQSVVDV